MTDTELPDRYAITRLHGKWNVLYKGSQCFAYGFKDRDVAASVCRELNTAHHNGYAQACVDRHHEKSI